MFTEDDIIDYFDQIQKIEKKMHETYQRLHEQLTHPKYKKIFASLANDEKTHYTLIENLKDLLRN